MSQSLDRVLNAAEGKELLELARRAVSVTLKELEPSFDPPVSASLLWPRPVFVTLRKKGRLRGCIGNLTCEKPLYDTVVDCALAAAFKDPRFDPIDPREEPLLEYEVSVLEDFRRIFGPDEIEVGRDGLLIEKDEARGLLLPIVAVEFNVDSLGFLEMVCEKARLPKGAWLDASIQAFRAQVFASSEDPGAQTPETPPEL